MTPQRDNKYDIAILFFIIGLVLGVFFTTSYIRWEHAVELRDKAKESYEYNAEHPPIVPCISDDVTFRTKDALLCKFRYELIIDWKDTTYSKLFKVQTERFVYNFGYNHFAKDFIEREVGGIIIDGKSYIELQDSILWLGNYSLPCGVKDSRFTKLEYSISKSK